MKINSTSQECASSVRQRVKAPLVIEIRLTRLLAAMIIGLLLGAMLLGLIKWEPQEAAASANPESVLSAASASTTRLRKYYLSDSSNFGPPQAPAGCADGYHFASLWELWDPSNLLYASDHPEAATRADSGTGPPTALPGWVRTGYSTGTNESTEGMAHCNGWTSSQLASDGQTVKLTDSWDGASTQISEIWEAEVIDCENARRIWCVED